MNTYGLEPAAFLASVIYAFIGILLMMLFTVFFNHFFKLDIHKELVRDNNTAIGILLAGVSIAIAIIIASAIH